MFLDTTFERRRRPYGVYGLLLFISIIYLLSVRLLYFEVLRYGFVPSRPDPAAFLLSLFLHSGVTHLLINLFLLWLFGRDVEEVIGSLAFITLYLTGGIVGVMVQSFATLLFLPQLETLPIVGGSASVSAVLGIYTVRFSYQRIRLRLGGVLLKREVHWEFPAIYLWVPLLLLQIGGAVGNLLGRVDPVAYWAHLAGFLFGIIYGEALGLRRECLKEGFQIKIQKSKEQNNLEEARKWLQKALQLDPYDPRFLLEQISLESPLPEAQKINTFLERSLSSLAGKGHPPLVLLTRCLLEKDYLGIIEPSLLLRLCRQLIGIKEGKMALAVAQSLLRRLTQTSLDPSQNWEEIGGEILYRIGQAWNLLGNKDAADKSFQTLIQQYPHTLWAQKALRERERMY